ncbi:hypothetical protein EYD79_00895 [Shigella sonnei]|nr:hypothetical protein [Escherichia coli]EFW5532193.1 hypothetical protein [Shigella sonnei]EFX7053201.1 hypothetical protein [Shigella sonnei]EFZ0655755.1 hypothetical protein [Shigella sonnei]EFZ2872798.1 hypothetical protein [Shigella sonnei]
MARLILVIQDKGNGVAVSMKSDIGEEESSLVKHVSGEVIKGLASPVLNLVEGAMKSKAENKSLKKEKQHVH